MAAIDQLLQPFARSIFAKTNALHCLELLPNQRTRLRRSITEDIRNCGGLIFPDVISPEVSKSAQEAAERIGVSIWTKNWHNQTSFDSGRTTFHWEHVNPISSIQVLCEQAKSEEEILVILKSRLRIAWILKREDEELTRLGYRSKREDPDRAYRDANIELRKLPGGERGTPEAPPEAEA